MQANDAHLHVGYFQRKGQEEPFYYSPRKMVGILKRCEVKEFVFSSTDCFAGISLEDIFREANEVRRLAGSENAHPFFWVSNAALKNDPDLKTLPEWYEGLKLHGGEFPWLEHPKALSRILSIAKERHYAVQIHTDAYLQSIRYYLPYCKKFPQVHFDLAHCASIPEVKTASLETENTWFDCSFSAPGTIPALLEANIPEERILWGSDMPAQKMFYENLSLTAYLRKELRPVTSPKIRYLNFRDFLSK